MVSSYGTAVVEVAFQVGVMEAINTGLGWRGRQDYCLRS